MKHMLKFCWAILIFYAVLYLVAGFTSIESTPRNGHYSSLAGICIVVSLALIEVDRRLTKLESSAEERSKA